MSPKQKHDYQSKTVRLSDKVTRTFYTDEQGVESSYDTIEEWATKEGPDGEEYSYIEYSFRMNYPRIERE